MSRKAKKPIPLPNGVEASAQNDVLTIKGPKGTLTRFLRSGIKISLQKDSIEVGSENEAKAEQQFLGLYWSLIANMVKGTAEGFEKRLEMIGVGYRAAVQGKLLVLQIGLSHPCEMPIPEGIEIMIEKNTVIVVKGIDKHLVGQFAQGIRAKRPPEPYKGKGIRYVGEYVRKKAGKSGKK